MQPVIPVTTSLLCTETTCNSLLTIPKREKRITFLLFNSTSLNPTLNKVYGTLTSTSSPSKAKRISEKLWKGRPKKVFSGHTNLLYRLKDSFSKVIQSFYTKT